MLTEKEVWEDWLTDKNIKGYVKELREDAPEEIKKAYNAYCEKRERAFKKGDHKKW